MGLSELFEAMKNAFSSLLDKIKDFVASLLYGWYGARAPVEQSKHLPASYSEYRHYKSTYGIAPGDAVTISDNPAVVVNIEGPPTINAEVTYHDLDEDIEYTTGLGNVLRQA